MKSKNKRTIGRKTGKFNVDMDGMCGRCVGERTSEDFVENVE